MPVVISMLRGVNVGGHNLIKMDPLRALYESLGLQDPATYVQSGNVIFKTKERDVARLAPRIQNEIERRFGFRPGVILRTSSDLQDVINRTPFRRAATSTQANFSSPSSPQIPPRTLGKRFSESNPIPRNCGSPGANSTSIFPTA